MLDKIECRETSFTCHLCAGESKQEFVGQAYYVIRMSEQVQLLQEQIAAQCSSCTLHIFCSPDQFRLDLSPSDCPHHPFLRQHAVTTRLCCIQSVETFSEGPAVWRNLRSRTVSSEVWVKLKKQFQCIGSWAPEKIVLSIEAMLGPATPHLPPPYLIVW